MLHNKLDVHDFLQLGKKFKAFDRLMEAGKPALGYIKTDPTLFAYFFFKDDKLQKFRALPWQDKFLNSKSNRNLLCCSRQVGKSTAVAIKAIWLSFFNPGYTILVVSKTKPQAVELVYRMRKFLNVSQHKIIWSQLGKSGKENKHEIVIKASGPDKIESRIIVVPATDASLGFSANYVICDEFARWEDGDRIFLEDVEPTTFWTGGGIDLLSTPAGRQGLFYKFFNMQDIWEVFHYDYTANPKNTVEKMEEKRRTHTILSFAMNFEAKFVSSESAYYTPNEIQKSIHPEANQGWRGETSVSVGVDFGKVHDSCVIDIGVVLNPDKPRNEQIIRLVERRVKPLGTGYDLILEELKVINHLIRPQVFVLDTTSGDVPADILIAAGLPVESFKFTIPSKIMINNNLKILMQQNRMQIPDERELIDQLEIFEYELSEKNQDRMMLHAPIGKHDDEVDALALMAYGLTKGIGYASGKFIMKGEMPAQKIQSAAEEKHTETVNKCIKANNDFMDMLAKNAG